MFDDTGLRSVPSLAGHNFPSSCLVEKKVCPFTHLAAEAESVLSVMDEMSCFLCTQFTEILLYDFQIYYV